MVVLAVASDLHVHQLLSPGEAKSFLTVGQPRIPWKSHPIEALKRLIDDSRLSAEVLLGPGDLAHACDTNGLTQGWAALNEIRAALGASLLIGTPGNHDYDSRHLHGSDPSAPVRHLPNSFPLQDATACAHFWNRHFWLEESESLELLVISSVANHLTPAEAEHGSVSPATLEAIEDTLAARSGSRLKVALVHHHPHLHEGLGLGAGDVMHGGQELIDLLTHYGFHLIIHGHKHHPKLSYAQGGSGSPVVFAAGSLCSTLYPQLSTNTRNLFHIIELDRSINASSTVAGRVHSWEYNCGAGWHPATIRSAGIPAQAGFGCRRTVNELLTSVLALTVSELSWGDLRAELPELAFVLPQDLAQLLARLRREHDIQVLHDDMGEPLGLRRRIGMA